MMNVIPNTLVSFHQIVLRTLGTMSFKVPKLLRNRHSTINDHGHINLNLRNVVFKNAGQVKSQLHMKKSWEKIFQICEIYADGHSERKLPTEPQLALFVPTIETTSNFC